MINELVGLIGAVAWTAAKIGFAPLIGGLGDLVQESMPHTDLTSLVF